MAKLINSIDYLLTNEGGYTVDHAGPTKYGITMRSLAEYRMDDVTGDDIKNLTLDEAFKVIKELYWDKLKLDQIESTIIATALLDVGYNRGVSIAAKYAQKLCCEFIEPIPVDGIIGPRTINAINKIEPNSFIIGLHGLVTKGYESVINTKPAYEMYRKGWIFRADRLLTLIES